MKQILSFSLLFCFVSFQVSGRQMSDENLLLQKMDSLAIYQQFQAISSYQDQLSDMYQKDSNSLEAGWASYYLALANYIREDSIALGYADKAVQIFKIKKEKSGWFKASYLLGNLYLRGGQFATSIIQYQSALLLLEENPTIVDSSKFELQLSKCYNNLSSCYIQTGDFEAAVETGLKGLTYAGNDPQMQINSCISLGNMHMELKEFEKAKSFYTQAVYVANKSKGLQDLAAYGYGSLGHYFGRKNQLDSALFYFHKALDIAIANDDYWVVTTRSLNISEIYTAQKNYAKAEFLLKKVKGIAETHTLESVHGNALLKLAQLKLLQQAPDEALVLLDDAILRFKQLADNNSLLHCYNSKHKAFLQLDRPYQALDIYKKKTALKDSLLNVTNLTAIAEMQTKYESTQKEQRIATLDFENKLLTLNVKQKRLWMFFGGIAILLLIGFMFFINRYRLQRSRSRRLEIEQRLLRLQMNPHFIFNSINSVQHYLTQTGKVEKGTYFLTKLAKLMRRTLENSRHPFISLEEEFETLEHYLSLQQIRFEESLNYEIIIDDNLETFDLLLPPLLVQPIVENAIEHGKVYAIPNGKITIRAWQENDEWMLSVYDNGLGKTATRNAKHKSLSSIITNERLALLQQVYKNSFSLNFSHPSKGGTLVTFRFPLLQTNRSLTKDFSSPTLHPA